MGLECYPHLLHSRNVEGCVCACVKYVGSILNCSYESVSSNITEHFPTFLSNLTLINLNLHRSTNTMSSENDYLF